MIIEVQLHHSSTGWFVISEPDGWPDAKLGFERHEDAFHCLVEFFRSAFRAYGSNGFEDGGRDKIKIIERDFGPGALIQSLIRIKDTEFDEFEDFYHGQIPVISLQEVIDDDHTIAFTNEQNDTWSKLISRLDTPVNIQSPTSIDGVAVDVIDPIEVTMTSQIIEKIYDSAQDVGLVLSEGWAGTGVPPSRTITTGFADRYLQFSFLTEDITEAGQVFTLLTDFNSQLPDELIIPSDDGDYRIQCRVLAGIIKGTGLTFGGEHVYNGHDFLDEGNNVRDILRFYYKKNDEAEVEFNSVTRGIVTNLGAELSAFDLDVTFTDLKTSDAIRIYGKFNDEYTGFTLGTEDSIGLIIYGKDNNNLEVSSMHSAYEADAPDFGVPITDIAYSYLKISAETKFTETTSRGFLIHDIARSILDRICDQNDTLVSEFLGNQSTTPSYDYPGCGSNNAGFKGLQLRGYTLSEKQFSISFKDFWEGIDPVYNLSLWPTRNEETGKITINIGQKRDVYIATESSVTISNVRKIGKAYDEQNIFNNYRIGYRQWESEDISGLDDPQTVHDRSNNLRNIGNKWEKLSSWVAASYAIETTRRTRKEKSADYKFDNDTFLIALSPSGGGFVPELDENFASVSGLRFPETRYNLRHTPARMFIRWLDYLSGVLQTNPGSGFAFQGGEGNYDMESEIDPGDCDYFPESVAEKQDLPVSSTFLFIPRLFTFDTPLTLAEYKSIRENPNASILVSQTDTDHVPMLIKDLEFTPYTGEATIKAWAKQWIDLRVVDDSLSERENTGQIFDETFDETFE